jgi:hypothetical protein
MSKLRCRLALVAFAIAALWSVPDVYAQQDERAEQAKTAVPDGARAVESPLVGTWKLQSYVYEIIGTGALSKPFGENPIGYLSYSKDGRMNAILVAEDRLKPGDMVPTDEEKIKLQGSMVAYAGTYTVYAEKIVHHVDISWNESWTGTDQVRFYKLDGDTLTITTAPGKSPFTAGEERRATLVWKKVQ